MSWIADNDQVPMSMKSNSSNTIFVMINDVRLNKIKKKYVYA